MTSLTLPARSLGDLLGMADGVLTEMRTRGIRTPPGNRLSNARAELRRLIRSSEEYGTTSVERRAFAGLLRTILEAHIITKALPAAAAGAKLKSVIEGADRADQETNTRARDTQFELAVASLVRMAGIVGARFDEPDILIPAGDKFLAIAIKRVTSPKKIDKRLRKAIEQIRRSRLPGLVVMGFDFYQDLKADDAHRLTVSLTTECRELLQRFGAEGEVAGVLGISLAFRWRDASSVLPEFCAFGALQMVAPPEEQEPLRAWLNAAGVRVVAALQSVYLAV